MTDFYKRNSKKIIFVTFLFLLFFGGWWSLKYNLPKTVEVAVRVFVGPTLKSSSIEFEKNKIVVKDFILADKDEVIIDSPKVEILYSKASLKKFRVEEIILDGGTANITRRKNGDINIVAAFTGESEPEEKKEEKPKEEPYKPGISVPIDRITGKHITTNFKDLGYRLPIEQTAYDTNGYLTFSKEKGINLHFIGSNKEEIYDFAFSTEKEPYSMTLKLSNIGVKTELVQYGYDGKEVSYDGGKLNMDLTIAESGMNGWIEFAGVNVRYVDLDDAIESVTGRVDFKKEGIFLDANGKVFGKDEKFTLSYKDNELNIDFDLADIKKENLEKLSYLKGMDLPFNELNVDSVKFNLNLKEDLKVTIEALMKKAQMNGMSLENTQVLFVYDKNGIHLPKLETDLNVLDGDGKPSIVEKLNLSVNYGENRGDVSFDIKNINKKNYIPEFVGRVDFNILEKSIEFALDSNIIDLKGRYLTEEKKVQLDEKNQYFLEYDMTSKLLTKGEGDIKFSLFDNNFLIDYTVYNNSINLKSFSVVGDGEKNLTINGKIDLNELSYDLKLDSKKLHLKELLGEKDADIKGSFVGEISGVKDRFRGSLDISSIDLKYFVELNKLKGKITFEKDEKLQMNFNGEIGRVAYQNYDLNGLYVALRLKDNIFEIKNINNQLLNIFGNVDLNKNRVDLKAKVEKLSLKKFGIENPEIRLDSVVANLKGDLKNPRGSLNLEDVKIILENGEMITISGGANYLNNEVVVDRIKINNSILKGKYSIKDSNYRGTLNIIEDDIGRYYGNSSVKYRVIGTVKVKGVGKNIAVGLQSTVDKIYVSGNKLPTLYIDASYEAENLVDGIVNIKQATFSNSSLENLLTIVGNFDVPNNQINLEVKEQRVPLVKLKEYIPIEGIVGELKIKGGFGGKLDNLGYNLSISSEQLGVDNVLFNSLKTTVDGDLKKVNLKEFSFKYLDNLFYSRGEYDILNSKYIYKAEAKNINLDFLNIFLEKYGLTNIQGISTFNITIRDDRNDGFLKVKNFNLENKDLFLKLERFNSTIKLEGNDLHIDEFQGILNGGRATLTGELTLPSLKEISENPYYKEEMKYKANLKLENIEYKYGNYFGVDFSTDINLSDNKIFGQIDILRGEVSEIPNTSKSLFQKIKEFLFSSSSKTVNQSEDLGSDFKIETVLENALEINVGVKISEEIKLDIDNLNSFVSDIKGGVVGNGTLSGKDGKYTFIGNVEVLGGSLNVNDNVFYLDRALVIFNDPKCYIPKVNPNLLVDARVNVQDEEIGLSLNGNLDNLRFTINSKNGSSSGNLNSLLTDTESVDGNNEATTTLITNVIGGQLTQVLRPVSNLIKNTLNISKFRISSNLLSEQNKNSTNNENTQSRLRLGAVLEAEDNIYKDKIWWVAKGTLLEDDSTESEKRSNDNSGALKEYDISLEYRFDTTKSIGIGVGKLPDDQKTASDKESKQDLNYHIDFKFQKKYDSLLDIFRNK